MLVDIIGIRTISFPWLEENHVVALVESPWSLFVLGVFARSAHSGKNTTAERITAFDPCGKTSAIIDVQACGTQTDHFARKNTAFDRYYEICGSGNARG